MCQKRSSVKFCTNDWVLLLSLVVVVNAACSSGFFNNSSSCETCPEHCIVCNSSDYCYMCENGFFGRTCQFFCNNCLPHTECTKDNGFCVINCTEGLSGQRCDTLCDSRCTSCDRQNAVNCLTCKNNQTCKLTCPCVNCPESYCSEGCLEGYWGDSCHQDCPANCYGSCYRENGTCSKVSVETSNLPESMIVLATVPVILLIIAGGIIFVTNQLRRKFRPLEENKQHQNTDESGELYNEIGQLTENNQSSLQSPANSANDHRQQYDRLEIPIYTPLR